MPQGLSIPWQHKWCLYPTCFLSLHENDPKAIAEIQGKCKHLEEMKESVMFGCEQTCKVIYQKYPYDAVVISYGHAQSRDVFQHRSLKSLLWLFTPNWNYISAIPKFLAFTSAILHRFVWIISKGKGLSKERGGKKSLRCSQISEYIKTHFGASYKMYPKYQHQ